MGVIEPSYGLYQNSWYLVKKSISKKYRFINIAVKLNQVTIRDANLPLSTNEFSEEFTSCTISSLKNFF